MYIIDVAGTWSQQLHTDRKLFIDNNQFILKLKQSGVNFVFVDTSKVQAEKTTVPAIIRPVKDEEEIKEDIKQSIEIQAEARKTVIKIISDFQNGKKLEISKAEDVIGNVTEKILHNKFVLAGLSSMKQKNHYLYEHALSSSVLMIAFAHTWGFEENKQRIMGLGAMLYDLGMLIVPSQILNLPGKLSSKQLDLMRRHVEYSYEILKNEPQISEDVLLMASEHHERLDGSGYPLGLKEKEISTEGKMIGIVDVYDASTSDRGYNKGMLPAVALSKLFKSSGVLFDKTMVNLFIKTIGIYPFGSLVRLKNGLIGIVVRINQDHLIYPQLRIIFNPQKGGMITPYNLDLQNFMDIPEYKIQEVVPKSKFRLRNEEILRIIGVV